MLRLKTEQDLYKLGLRIDAADPTKAVSLYGPTTTIPPAMSASVKAQTPEVGNLDNGGSGTVPCPVCGRQICSCLLQDREYLARVVGKRMRGKVGSPATSKGGNNKLPHNYKRPFVEPPAEPGPTVHHDEESLGFSDDELQKASDYIASFKDPLRALAVLEYLIEEISIDDMADEKDYQ